MRRIVLDERGDRVTTKQLAERLAATATLAVNPRAAQDPAWQLSFAAVLAIGVAQSAPSPKRPAQPGASLRD